MSRIIRTEGGATHRTRILRAMAHAIRSTAGPDRPSPESLRDVFAFLALSLAELEASVETTAVAWERREYWLKADQFRQEWAWIGTSRVSLEAALSSADLEKAGVCGIELATRLAGRNLRVGKSAGRPWHGAWEVWRERRGARGSAPPAAAG